MAELGCAKLYLNIAVKVSKRKEASIMNSYSVLNESFANSKDIRKNTKAKRFLAFDETENTFRVIPKLEDLDKRLMSYLNSVLSINHSLMKEYQEQLYPHF